MTRICSCYLSLERLDTTFALMFKTFTTSKDFERYGMSIVLRESPNIEHACEDV